MNAQTPARFQIRPHNLLAGLKGGLFKKIPKDFGGQEDNVVLGLGSQTLAGAGGFSLTVSATRDMILRDLILQFSGTVDVQITSITANGMALLQGSGVPASVFAANNQNRPDFSFPIAGGTPVVISGSSSGATVVSAAFAID
jgi:hypothetical protein